MKADVFECAHCGRVERCDGVRREHWHVIDVFDHYAAGGDILASNVVVCDRPQCRNAVMRRIWAGAFIPGNTVDS